MCIYVSHQAPLSMGFPRQDYWSGLPFPSPGIMFSKILSGPNILKFQKYIF